MEARRVAGGWAAVSKAATGINGLGIVGCLGLVSSLLADRLDWARGSPQYPNSCPEAAGS